MHTTQENYLAGRKPGEINNSGGRGAGIPGEGFNSQPGMVTMGTGHLGTQGVTSNQIGYQAGHQYLSGRTGHLGTQSVGVHPARQSAWQTGQQAGMEVGMQAGMQMGSQKFGAFELIEVHEVLNCHIDKINQFELLKPHIKDQALMQILDNQVNYLFSSYQTMVNYLHNQGVASAAAYRVPKSGGIKYGLRQPAPEVPNTGVNMMDDRDVASLMLGSAKASAAGFTKAALECAEPNLRNMVVNSAVSSINQAYELFYYMNQRGMYQLPTLADNTTQTMIQSYQAGSMPTFQ